MSITCVTLLLQFSDVRNVLTSFNNAKMADALNCSIYLVAGVGGKLSRPVYLAPPPTHLGIKIKLFANSTDFNATKKTAEFDLSYVYI